MTTHSKISDMRKKVAVLMKDPERELTITDIKREGLMPWAKHHRTILGIVKADRMGQNMLKAKVEGEGNNTRYTIKSKNIIKYLEAYGPALISLGHC